jgi:lysyl-tRNA synthetase class 2
MLEWYRPGWSYHQLIDEVEALLAYIASTTADKATPRPAGRRVDYRSLFRQTLELDPMTAGVDECRACCRRHNLPLPESMDGGVDAWLDLMMAALIGPRLPADTPTVVYDYPGRQAALARTRQTPDGAVAERFEVYWGELELANGFQELTDPVEQRRRFDRENVVRRERGLPPMPVDERFLSALEAGMPECSGVALGVDRLLMALSGARDIREVTAFGDEPGG